MKKIKLFIIAFIFSVFTVKAQFTGPVSNVLNTANYINIEGEQVLGLPGGPSSLPLFAVNTKNTPNILRFSVDHDRIDANTNFFINSKAFYITRGGSAPGNALSFLPGGAFTLNTNGVINPLIGFFINSNNRNFFSISEEQILFKDATRDLFKVDANGFLYTRKAIVTLTNPYPDYVFEKTIN